MMQHLLSFNESFKEDRINKFSKAIIALQDQSYDVAVKFNADYREAFKQNTAIQRIYNQLKDIIFPSLSNDVVTMIKPNKKTETLFIDHKKDLNTLKKNKNLKYYVTPLPTQGRYDINSYMNYNMTDREKDLAKSIYKGRNNYEYHFKFRDDTDIDIIVSKSGKHFTLANEDGEVHLPKLFVKIPKWDTVFLKEGWVKEDRLIEILKKLDEKVLPIYKSKKLIKTNIVTGVFEHLNNDYNFIQLVPNERNDCFILEGHLDKDSYITYGIYLNGEKKGEEWMEYYTGSNYKIGSTVKSHSRHYASDQIPKKWKNVWLNLKEIAKRDYPIYFSDILQDTTRKTGVFDLPF